MERVAYIPSEARDFKPRPYLVQIDDSIRTEKIVDFPTSSQGENRFIDEFSNIDRLRNVFDTTLKIDTRGQMFSYDPVLSRNRFEQCQTDEEREAFKVNEVFEIESTLRERYQAGGRMDFIIDDEGNLRNERFQVDTLKTILERGVAHRRRLDSKDIEREEAEVRGILSLQERINASKVGEIVGVISGPSLLFLDPESGYESPYKKNFVDLYQVKEDPLSKQKRVEALRYHSDMSYDEYKEAIESRDRQYFTDQRQQVDAHFLSKPIDFDTSEFSDFDEIIDTVFRRDPNALKEKEFQDYIYQFCLPYIHELVESLAAPDFNPRTIVARLNTLLHKGDKARDLLKQGLKDVLKQLILEEARAGRQKTTYEIASLGSVAAGGVAGGCGLSVGFGSAFDNSVGMFGVAPKHNEYDNMGSLFFPCPRCGVVNKRPKGELLTNCYWCAANVRCDETGEKEKAQKEKTALEQEEARQKIISFEQKKKEREKAKTGGGGILLYLFGIDEDKKAA